ncbi:hypothetical protein [Aridibaculum aurantiacum]|uniref:hypothetical protein n=1 Tax=Aridibaculum aurantiacum TaxID=2810307 RepID=UPI001A96F4D1|nr:hypothetical protein [Aridibaculum aurantiacum]
MAKQFNFRFFFLYILATVFSVITVSAQNDEATTLKSRLAVVALEDKTNIWVSDFPKGSTVVLFDEEDNLITITSTNEYGAAYISLPKTITTTIFAKTMNGEINVSNKAARAVKEQNVASKNDQSSATKA